MGSSHRKVLVWSSHKYPCQYLLLMFDEMTLIETQQVRQEEEARLELFYRLSS